MKTKEQKQLMQLEFLIREFYSGSKVYQVDEVEERIYFFDVEGDDMQAVIDREGEHVEFLYLRGEDWYSAGSASFIEVNEVNEAAIF